MKYYVIEITTYNNGTADGKGVYEYASETEAMAAYHTKMGGAMKNAGYESELIIVSNSIGGILKVDYFNRSTGTEEPTNP